MFCLYIISCVNPIDYSRSSNSLPQSLTLSAIKIYLAKDKHTYLVSHISSKVLWSIVSHQIGTYLRWIMSPSSESFLLDLCSWFPPWENKNLLNHPHNGTRKLPNSQLSYCLSVFQQVYEETTDCREHMKGQCIPQPMRVEGLMLCLSFALFQIPSLLLQFLNSSELILVQV